MMAVIFAVMTGALGLAWFGRRGIAVLLVSITLLLAIHLFLWEIHDPQYGFRMPWIQT